MLKRNVFYLARRSTDYSLLPGESLRRGWELFHSADLATARRILSDHNIFVGVVDFSSLQPDSALQWQDELAQINPTMLWIALVPPTLLNVPQFRHELAGRFFDYHTIPHDPERLLIILSHAFGMAILNPGKADEDSEFNHNGLIGESAVMKSLYSDIGKAAGVDYPVLIHGESGTGKELLAQAIHKSSPRANGPFVAVNSAALPGNLIQAELFGHEKGAFTGATEAKIGRIEAANGGTLFLDEIGDLSAELQVVLLRFLQEGVIQRVGSTRDIPIDVRIVAATHVDLDAAVAEDRFREDLYYRINVLRIAPPPLRERGNDVIMLANYFLETLKGEKSSIIGYTAEALDTLAYHSWPGNVRELINRIRRATVMSESRLVSAGDLGFTQQQSRVRRVVSLEEARTAAERQAIQAALWHSGNNVSMAAKSLDISRMTLYRLMEKVGISAETPVVVDNQDDASPVRKSEIKKQRMIDRVPSLQANY
jgi:DNA-binding NtrC family response regulator